MQKVLPSEHHQLTPQQLRTQGIKCCDRSEYQEAQKYADRLFELKHYQPAIDLYQCIIQDNPEHDFGIAGLGNHEEQVGFYEWHAYRWYDQQRRGGVFQGSPYDGLSLCCHSHSKYEEGIKWYAEMARKHPKNYQIVYGHANILYNNGIYQEAAKTYETVIKLKPDFVKPYVDLAFTFEYKRIEKAKSVYWAERALEVEPRNQYARFIIARSERDIDKKIRDLQETWGINEEYTRVANEVGICFGSKKKDYKEAIKWYKKCTRINPQYMSCYNNIGVNYELLKRYEQAKIWYFRAIEKEETYKAPHANLYDIFKELKASEEDILSLAEQYETREEKFCYYFGLACYDKKKIDESIKWIQKAIAINPNSHAYHNSIGISYDDLKDYEMAIFHYTRCMELNPKYHSAYYNIAIVYKAMKDEARAIEWYKRAIAVNPRYSYAYNNLANIYKNNKNYQEAIKYYKKAVEHNSTYTLAYVNMGVCALNIENYRVAYEAFARASAVIENDNNNLSQNNKDFIKPHFERFKKEGESWRKLGFASNSEKGEIKLAFQKFEKDFSLVKKALPLPHKADVFSQKFLDILDMLLEGNFSLDSLSHIIPMVKALCSQDIGYFSIIPELVFYHFWSSKYNKKRHFQDLEAELSAVLAKHGLAAQTRLRMNSEGLMEFREQMGGVINNESTVNLFSEVAFFQNHQEVCSELLRINEKAQSFRKQFTDILDTVAHESKGRVTGVIDLIPDDPIGKACGLMRLQESIYENDLDDAHFTALTGWVEDGLQQTRKNEMSDIIKHFVSGINNSLDELFTKNRFANKKETACIMDGLVVGNLQFGSLPDIAQAIRAIQKICEAKGHWMAAVRDRLSNSQFQDVLVVLELNQSSYFSISLSLEQAREERLWTQEQTQLSTRPMGCVFSSVLYLAKSQYSLLGHAREIADKAESAKVKQTAAFVHKTLGAIQ